MENLLSIINRLPLVIEILRMLIQMAVPITGKQLWAFEREIHKLTAKIGDQLILRALRKAHKDEKFVKEILRKARLDIRMNPRSSRWMIHTSVWSISRWLHDGAPFFKCFRCNLLFNPGKIW